MVARLCMHLHQCTADHVAHLTIQQHVFIAFCSHVHLAPCCAEVPAGHTFSQGVLVPCAPGTYREGLADLDTPVACTPCANGWTTAAKATTSAAGCNCGFWL
jgi:hypothetical protein